MNTEIKTHNLTGPALDWAVAKAEGYDPGWLVRQLSNPNPETRAIPGFSADWSVGGPLIEREKIEWQWLPSSHKAHQYGARKPSLGGLYPTFCMDGPTVLVAAMRCYVASKLGDEVEIPEELV